MTIIEALEAAKADGKYFFSSDYRCDACIDNELREKDRLTRDTAAYVYEESNIYRLTADGSREHVYMCQSVDEVFAEREAEE